MIFYTKETRVTARISLTIQVDCIVSDKDEVQKNQGEVLSYFIQLK
jgi:hypothetical protein